MEQDYVIDKILYYLNEDEMVFLVEDLDIAQVLNVSDSLMSICLERANKLGLTDNDNNVGNYSYVRLSPLGKKVQDSGGWIVYLGKQSISNKSAQQKAKNDLILSNFQVKTRHYPLVISMIALMISIISLVKSCTNQQLSKPPVIKTKVSTISTSIQTKKADSLSNSKNLKNS